MTSDDVVRLAKEARFETVDILANHWKELHRFAALVAAAEREACAALVDANAAVCRNNSMLADVLAGNADAIRARKDKQ